MDLGIHGRVALVIGASRGIGAATARQLAAEGARVAIVSRGGDALSALARELGETGAEVLAISADMLDKTAAERVVDQVVEQFGSLDIAVACVGDAQGGVFWDIEDHVWDAALDLKFKATVRILKAVLQPMRRARYGRIAVVVGNSGKQPSAKMLPGAAANAACLALIKGVADQVAGDGITVNAINPGPTRTDRWSTLMTRLSEAGGTTAEQAEAEFLQQIPVGRINEPDEIGRLVTLMVSTHVSAVTGTSLLVDGGATKAIA